MGETRQLAADPAELLKQDHDRLRILFRKHAQTEAGNSEARELLFREIRREVRIHTSIERDCFYPALGNSLPAIHEDHVAIDGLLDKLSRMSVTDKSYDALLKLLEENFVLHATAEERDLFPQLRRLPEYTRYELTIQLEKARVEVSRAADSTDLP